MHPGSTSSMLERHGNHPAACVWNWTTHRIGGKPRWPVWSSNRSSTFRKANPGVTEYFSAWEKATSPTTVSQETLWLRGVVQPETSTFAVSYTHLRAHETPE